MSQQVLADLAGVSQGYVSQIEAGKRPLERRSTQVALANALNVSVAQLVGLPSDRTDPLLDRALAQVPEVREVVVELAAGERRTPARGREELIAAATTFTELSCRADHAALLSQLAGLLSDTAAHGPVMAPALAEVAAGGVYALKSVGHIDLARSMVEAVTPLVNECESPAWAGQMRYSWAQTLPAESAGVGLRSAQRAAWELEGSVDPEALQVYGHLQLMSAMSAAVAMRADDAYAFLAEAEVVAMRLGEPTRTGLTSAGFSGNWFGPTNVAFWRVAVCAELGDLRGALLVRDTVNL